MQLGRVDLVVDLAGVDLRPGQHAKKKPPRSAGRRSGAGWWWGYPILAARFGRCSCFCSRFCSCSSFCAFCSWPTSISTLPTAVVTWRLTPSRPSSLLLAKSLKSVKPLGSPACSPGAKIGKMALPPTACAASSALARPGLWPRSISCCLSSSPAMMMGLSGYFSCKARATWGRLPESNAATVAKPSASALLAAVA